MKDCSVWVFPAYAGVFLDILVSCRIRDRLPRIRGGVSGPPPDLSYSSGSSPHTRGCFFSGTTCCNLTLVFPAYAGVFLCQRILHGYCNRLPRIRGGVSMQIFIKECAGLSSPHTRGCFFRKKLDKPFRTVFPAYAGVFPQERAEGVHVRGLPRIRGGVSD